MKRALISVVVVICLVMVPALSVAQEDLSAQTSQESSEQSLQQSSEDSLQQSTDESSQQTTEQSTQQSSENSSQNSFQYSTDQTSGSFSATTNNSSQSTEQSEASFVVVVTIAGAAVAIGLTALGIVYIVKVRAARQENVLALQDEIYAADGVEYANLITTFSTDDVTVVRANDELVTVGYVIDSDHAAAKYLAELVYKLAGGRPFVLDDAEG
jgi:DNA mismatch repair ATPase MutL